MDQKSVRRALVDGGSLGNLLQRKAGRIPMKHLKDLQYFPDYSNRSRFRFARSDHAGHLIELCSLNLAGGAVASFYWMKPRLSLVENQIVRRDVYSPASQQPGGTRRHVFDLKNAVLVSQVSPSPIVSDLAGGGKSKRECSRGVTPVKQADHEVVR